MTRNDAIFIACVCGFALVLGAMTISSVMRSIEPEMPIQAVRHTTAGVPRDADMDRIRRLIDSGYLSGREALHYIPLPDATRQGPPP